MSLTIDQLFLQTRRVLQDAGIDSAAIDAKVLMLEVLDWEWSDLIAKGQCEADAYTIRQVEVFRQRRIDGEPVAYIVGRQEFFGHLFSLNESTLIPRADSEVIVEASLNCIGKLRERNSSPDNVAVLDLGTGSGALLLSILCEVPDACGLGIDISPRALEIVRSNARSLNVIDRVCLVCGNWADSLSAFSVTNKSHQISSNVDLGHNGECGCYEGFDIIVANPPYIAADNIEKLDREVAGYEPRRALDGGPDGLLCYKAIKSVFCEKLRPGGFFIVEHGAKQQKKVADILFDNAELTFCEDLSDLAGRPRGLVGQRNFSRD